MRKNGGVKVAKKIYMFLFSAVLAGIFVPGCAVYYADEQPAYDYKYYPVHDHNVRTVSTVPEYTKAAPEHNFIPASDTALEPTIVIAAGLEVRRKGNIQLFLNNGRQVAAWTYNGNGTITKTGARISGTVMAYNPGGYLKEKIEYRDNMRNGICRYYYDNGSLSEKIMFHNDLMDGEYESYYRDGRLMKRGIYRSGKKEGLFRDYYENKNVSQETEYEGDIRHGKSTVYDESGKNRGSEFYDHGVKRNDGADEKYKVQQDAQKRSALEYNREYKNVVSPEGSAKEPKSHDDAWENYKKTKQMAGSGAVNNTNSVQSARAVNAEVKNGNTVQPDMNKPGNDVNMEPVKQTIFKRTKPTDQTTQQAGHVTRTVEIQAGYVTRTVEAQAGHVTRTVEAQAGHATRTVEAQAVPVTRTVEAQAGHATRTVEAQAGHVTRTVEAQAVPVTRTVEAQSGHVTRTVEAQAGHVTRTVEAQAVPVTRTVEAQAAPETQSDAIKIGSDVTGTDEVQNENKVNLFLVQKRAGNGSGDPNKISSDTNSQAVEKENTVQSGFTNSNSGNNNQQ
jgi:hypothetical protein